MTIKNPCRRAGHEPRSRIESCHWCRGDAAGGTVHRNLHHGGGVDPACPICVQAPALPAQRISEGGTPSPCVHLGELIEARECDSGCRKGTRIKVFQCVKHGECTTQTKLTGVACCALDGKTCYQAPPPPPPWILLKEKGPDDPQVIAAYRDALRQASYAAREQAYPAEKFAGRGIVIPAGGECRSYPTSDGQPVPYFWLAYAAAWFLRRRGCLLPLQFWFLGSELTQEMRDSAATVGAECVDAEAIGIQRNMRIVGGWQLKVHAIMRCPFEEVIYLDSDCLVTRDPTYLFWEPGYWSTGALFWGDNPDHWSGRTTREHAERTGIPELEGEVDHDTGQIVIDKKRCWQALHVVKHLADHSDYWGGSNNAHAAGHCWYGDKTDFHVGFRAVAKDYHQYGPFRWNKTGGFYEHRDARDRFIFQHCAHGKGKILQGEHIPNLDGHKLVREAWAFRGIVPWCQSIEETDKLLNPRKFFELGDGHHLDESVWKSVTIANEYRLPEDLRGANVFDVGGNVGAFAYAAARRGARVVSVEPVLQSAERLRKNVAGLGVQIVMAAAWRSDRPGTRLDIRCDPEHGPKHTGGYSAFRSVGDVVGEMETLAFDYILTSHFGRERIRLLKLDCEGAEFPILYTSAVLDQVDEIAGEYHLYCDPVAAGEPPSGGWPPWTGDGLREFLAGKGFAVEIVPDGGDLGHFFAWRC